ncbi:hypothetical protein N7517_004866 [Penicillium concentricum]|uniref:NAD-dependent epimerase/dehydratase domain-containing protein n=1 Tax=Penicillium concentricum TaxID=293559 RepID=A0A9W9S6N5_9EURO|nr:uncharacterized protein N7517_004866 [Penicillium concentricum]KAJ5372860.1 hypothetical protein N7517_004866 [Penicillium concentricum]
MSTKVFVTGITGYIGGQTVLHLLRKLPELSVTALIRDERQAAAIKAAFPQVKTVVGHLDSVDTLARLSAESDVVLQCASADHAVAVAAIIKGIKSKPTGSAPGFLIHTSGTGILGNPDQAYGAPPDREYDDVSDIKIITNFPLRRWHRDVDKLVLEASAGDDPVDNAKIKTAIVCPPTIYGRGDGPIRVRSVQLPDLANSALRRGGSLTVNEGKNEWRNVHVADLANAYVLLIEEALRGGGKADWNSDGYYFVENGHHVWKDLAKAVAEVGFKKGYFKSDNVDVLSVEETLEVQPTPHPGPDIWGVNSLGYASRIRSLGWKAQKPPIWEYVSEAVDIEAEALGLRKWAMRRRTSKLPFFT